MGTKVLTFSRRSKVKKKILFIQTMTYLFKLSIFQKSLIKFEQNFISVCKHTISEYYSVNFPQKKVWRAKLMEGNQLYLPLLHNV